MGEVWRASFLQTLATEEVVNTLHVEWDEPGTPSDAALSSLATRLRGWWTDEIAFSTGLRLDRLTLQEQEVVPPATAPVFSYSSGSVGANGGQLLPYQCCVVVSFRSALGGGHYRGRWFQPGLVVADITVASTPDGMIRVAPTCLARLGDAFQKLPDAVDGTPSTPWRLIIYGREVAARSPVTDFRIGNVVDTQRRRRPTFEIYNNYVPF